MGSDDKRDALRVPCDIPVRVYGQMREVTGRMINISRTGLRIRVPLSRLMIQADTNFAAFAHAVEQMLGGAFMVDLHHEMLGQLIRKRLLAVRVGTVDSETDELEMGCTFEQALTDEETAMLGIGLPPVGVTSAAAFKNVPPPKRRGDPDADPSDQPRPVDYEGILHPGEGCAAQPLVGSTEGVLGNALLLAIPIRKIPGAMGADARALVESLQREFGPRPRLEILDGLLMVWAGPVQLQEIELPVSDTGEALLLLKTA